MKITPDRLTVARAVRDQCANVYCVELGSVLDDDLDATIAAIPEPLPEPTRSGFYWVRWSENATHLRREGGFGVSEEDRKRAFIVLVDPTQSECPVNLVGSDEGFVIDQFEFLAGPLITPPDVQAQDTRQDTRPPCNCPRDYAQYLGDDPHNRWCPRSRNPHPEVIQAQIDAARAEEREACAKVAEAIWDSGNAGAHGGEQANRTAAAIRARSDARGHDWFRPDIDSLKGVDCCRVCGVVRRADDKNNPCRGPVSVTTRSGAGGA